MIATVVGATGLTGSYLMRELHADPSITNIVSIARKRAQEPNSKLTEILISDLNQLSSVELKTPGGLFFCCLGTTIKKAGNRTNFEKVDHAAIVAFAQLAKKSDAQAFILVSAMGANAKSMIFYNQVKGRTEEDVRALNLNSTIIFRPALLTGPRQEFRLAENFAEKTLIPITRLLPPGLQKKIITPAETLAARMLAEGKSSKPGLKILNAKDI